jgi:hypothetical protein
MQQTIDQVVECFFSGKKGSIARASALFEEKLLDQEEGAPEDFEFCGTIIPNHCLEPNLTWDVGPPSRVCEGVAPGSDCQGRRAVAPRKARFPANNSNSKQPNAQTSVRASTSLPRARSGLMYAGVPTTCPGRLHARQLVAGLPDQMKYGGRFARARRGYEFTAWRPERRGPGARQSDPPIFLNRLFCRKSQWAHEAIRTGLRAEAAIRPPCGSQVNPATTWAYVTR